MTTLKDWMRGATARLPSWYDAQYDNRARIPGHPAILARWAADSAAAYAAHPAVRRDVRCGDADGERLDVFPAARAGSPVLVHIHGGYWRALSRRDHAFVAPPFVAAGAAVVLADHTLAPEASIETIVIQILRALVWVHDHAASFGGDAGRIVVSGHSAGGHLAAMTLACRWERFDPRLPPRLVRSALAISGVFDLVPLRHAPFLAGDLRLDEEGAVRVSPAAIDPPTAGTLAAVVGAGESDEFRRQSRLIRRAWGRARVPVCEEIAGRHHLDILDDLVAPGTRLHAIALALLGLDATR